MEVRLGTNQDVRVEHTGSNGTITNYTGNLTIQKNTDDGDIIFKCDDQSGGVTTYFFLDGSNSSGNPVTIFPEDSKLAIGAARHGISLVHDGSNSTITKAIGDVRSTNFQNDGDVVCKSDDGSGSTTAYVTIDGGNTRTNVHTH